MRLLLSLLAAWFTTVSCADSSEVVLNLPHGEFLRSPAIEVFFGDAGPYLFIVDTASTDSSISKSLADKLKIKYEQIPSASATLTIDSSEKYPYSEMVKIELGQEKINRRTRFTVKDTSFDNMGIHGYIGLSTLYDAVFINLPDQKKLQIRLDKSNYGCDPLEEKSKCKFVAKNVPYINVQIGSQTHSLFLDTGYQGASPFILFKTDFTNELWKIHSGKFETEDEADISNLPLGRIFTEDFIFGDNENCFADFYIKDPSDQSPKIPQNIGTLGWWIIKDVPFTFNVKTRMLTYGNSPCPYQKVNTLGVGAKSNIGNGEQAYLHSIIAGSPAEKAGLRNDDIVERIHLHDGTIIETFNDEFFSRVNDIIYARNGTPIKMDVMRNGDIETLNFVTKGPNFLRLKDIE